MKNLAILLLAGGLALGVNSSRADEVKVPVGAQAKSDIQTPKRGTLKSQVRKKYGEPNSVSGPVGNPPISQWRYNGFTVYFEYNHVVHAVVHRS
ncbi:hypothetical protein [Kangiella sp. TOML190]|uniref:hypothetical protein n=1 Tax=Kangiella sp. TOML190 TaxID=2931351 RepID=UPI00203C20E0|nr:hypothetical protein [Kangiella sp. TOML190]